MLLIPRVIHHIWVGSEIPKVIEARRKGWAFFNPGWQLKLWTEETVFSRYPDLIRRCTSYPQMSDFYRTEILYREGGVYVDVDFEATSSIEPLLDELSAFTVVEHESGSRRQLSVGLVGTIPGHPLYAEILNLLPARFDPGNTTALGPALLTEVAPRHPSLTVFPKATFYPKGRVVGTYAFHHPRSGDWKGDSAAFVVQEVPARMAADSLCTVRVAMRNTGSNGWAEAEKVRLGVVGDSYVWGFPRALMPMDDATVKPGATRTFDFRVRAPKEPGLYNFQWRMVREGVQWFGDQTPLVAVEVG